MIVRCINSDYIIIFLLIVIAVLLVKRRYSKFEHMSNVDVEALRNLSSMYNEGKLKVTELEVTGKTDIDGVLKVKELKVTGKTDIDGVLTVGDNKFTKNDVTLKGRIKMDHNWAFFPKNDKHIHVTNHKDDKKPGAVIAAARFYTMG